VFFLSAVILLITSVLWSLLELAMLCVFLCVDYLAQNPKPQCAVRKQYSKPMFSFLNTRFIHSSMENSMKTVVNVKMYLS
jgi:hypothetical protein